MVCGFNLGFNTSELTYIASVIRNNPICRAGSSPTLDTKGDNSVL